VHKIAILPTLFTLGNAVCGFASIAYASRIRLDGAPDADNNWYFQLSALLILGAMVFDALDGYIARLSKSSSDFGGQLDSLCDGISFGLAPAFLLLRMGHDWQTHMFRQAIAVIAALYMVCALLRLARFNLQNNVDPASHKRFKGLPSPAAAGCVATVMILRGELSYNWAGLNEQILGNILRIWAPLGTLLVALLMVSNFSYPHFTNQLMKRRRRFDAIIQAVLIVGVLALMRELALFILFWVYALYAPVYSLVSRRLRRALSAHRSTVD
jgi:CDP-diacylglycerol--serine O-phosphatidyltransferase